MEIQEVAEYLRTTNQEVVRMITEGYFLPRSNRVQKLNANKVGNRFVISDKDLDDFQQAFDAEEPGRNPPTAVMRKLRVEACHKCGICLSHLPLQFHHIIEWSSIKHYDCAAMIAICGGCHDKINRGQIDKREQMAYKRKLLVRTADLPALDAQFQSLMATGQATVLIASVISNIASCLSEDPGPSQDQFTLKSLMDKNILNGVSDDYYRWMLEEDDVHVFQIDAFLKLQSNSKIKSEYLKVCSDLKKKLILYQSNGLPFEFCLTKLQDTISDRQENPTDLELRAVQAMVSFMYLNCDIGRKQ